MTLAVWCIPLGMKGARGDSSTTFSADQRMCIRGKGEGWTCLLILMPREREGAIEALP